MTSAFIGASRVEPVDENVAALAQFDFAAEELSVIDTILSR